MSMGVSGPSSHGGQRSGGPSESGEGRGPRGGEESRGPRGAEGGDLSGVEGKPTPEQMDELMELTGLSKEEVRDLVRSTASDKSTTSYDAAQLLIDEKSGVDTDTDVGVTF